jgi:hypothetical protein
MSKIDDWKEQNERGMMVFLLECHLKMIFSLLAEYLTAVCYVYSLFIVWAASDNYCIITTT